MERRKRGSTLALVVVCMLIIIMIGIFAFFLAKLMGGGREVANATDAGALGDAKTALATPTAAPTTPMDFRAFEYPAGSGITLLTYNRCVAAAILVALNAKDEGSAQAIANATKVVQEVNTLGTSLTGAVNGSNGFNAVAQSNGLKMFGNNNISGGKLPGAYMKPQGATNVFFSSNSLNGFAIPISNSTFTPQNTADHVASPTKYMAGYVPINVTGGTLYGTPVFPQQAPHLVAVSDFNAAKGAYGTAPPNAFEWQAQAQDRMTQSWGGSVAAAIVGAVAKGGSGGSLGSGFEFPASLPYGYIEFLNWQANPKPPGYDPATINAPNIFNQELGWGQTTDIAGDAANGNAAQNFAFCTTATPPGGGAGANSLSQWLAWAGTTPGGATNGSPPTPGNIFIGKLDSVAQQFSASNPPTGTTTGTPLYTLQTIAKIGNLQDCTQDLATPPSYGLTGACVPGFGTMLQTFNRKVPLQGPSNPTQNFSQVDWAKGSVIVAFQGKNMSGAATTGAQAGTASSFNRTVDVSIAGSTGVVPDSGVGLYAGFGVGSRLTNPMPPMAVPSPYQMPLEGPGSIWQMMNEILQPGCLSSKVLPEIVSRCQQIQPNVTKAQVIALLNSQPFPMAPYSNPSPSDTTAAKMYICLANQNDPTSALILTSSQPAHYPGFVDATSLSCPSTAGDCPDGTPPVFNSGPGVNDCYDIDYMLDQTLVDTANAGGGGGDELVHLAPYVTATPGAMPLNATDHCWWWPSSGATGCLGRMTFRETGLGETVFSHIN